jgi:hypothetical protein
MLVTYVAKMVSLCAGRRVPENEITKNKNPKASI